MLDGNGWFALYTTINGMDFLPYSVASIIDVIKENGGKIIFNEGCDSRAYYHLALKDKVTSDGLSTDGTTQYIDDLQAKEPDLIVHLRTGHASSHNALRRKVIDYVDSTEGKPFGIIIIDSDELFDKYLLNEAIYFIKSEQLEYLYIPLVHFAFDFFHVFDIDFNEQMRQTGLDGNTNSIILTRDGTKIVDGQYTVRIIKYHHGFQYPEGIARGGMLDSDGRNYRTCPEYQTKREVVNCPLFHFGPLHSFEKKMEKHIRRSITNVYDESAPSFEIDVNEIAKYVVAHEILTIDNADTNRLRRGKFYIRRYDGPYPEPIKLHPRFHDELFVLTDYLNGIQKYR